MRVGLALATPILTPLPTRSFSEQLYSRPPESQRDSNDEVMYKLVCYQVVMLNFMFLGRPDPASQTRILSYREAGFPAAIVAGM